MNYYDPVTGKLVEEAPTSGMTSSYTGTSDGVNPAYTGTSSGVNPAYTPASAGVNPAYTAASVGVNPAYTAASAGVNPTYTEPVSGMNPTGGFAGTSDTEDIGYDSMIGTPVVMDMPATRTADFGGGRSNKGPAKIIAGVIAGLIAVAAIAFVLIYNGVFLSNSGKVLYAISNTFKETPEMAKVFNRLDDSIRESYTMDLIMDVEGNSIEMQYALKDSIHQISGNINAEEVPDIDFLAELNASQLKVQVPSLFDSVFTYDYTQEKTGFLVEAVGSEAIAELDKTCRLAYSQEPDTEVNQDTIDRIKEEYEKLEFSTVDPKDFEVNGKTVKSKGYKTIITEANLLNYIDAMEEFTLEMYADDEEMLLSLEDAYEELRSEVIGFGSMSLTFYIAKNKLTCLTVEVNGEAVDILFRGQEDGMYDIAVATDNITVFELDGSKSEDTERYGLKTMGMEFMSFEYNIRSGEYELEVTDYTETMVVKGLLQSTEDSATFSIDAVQGFDEVGDMKCSVSIKKGAQLDEFTGEEFDLGNATEEEMMEVMMGMYSMMY